MLRLDYQEIAMYFDRLVRRHDVKKTLRIARKMFAEYLNEDWKRDHRINCMDSASGSGKKGNVEEALKKC